MNPFRPPKRDASTSISAPSSPTRAVFPGGGPGGGDAPAADALGTIPPDVERNALLRDWVSSWTGMVKAACANKLAHKQAATQTTA